MWNRAWDACRRRLRRARRWVAGRSALAPAEAAVEWILRQQLAGGLPAREYDGRVCAATTQRAIAVLQTLGLPAAVQPGQNANESAAAETAALDAEPNSSARLAAQALAAYRAGDVEQAGHAMTRLIDCQDRDGGFPAVIGGQGFFVRRRGRPRSIRAALDFLEAARWQVRSAFAAHAGEFPADIDPGDGRWQAVAEWLERLPPAARVADLGCGKGRFLRRMQAHAPARRFLGVDVAPAMLAALPAGMAGVAAELLRLPLADGTVDGALAVESLEHALLPRAALEEMCRVVRPDGWVLIIDKDRALQPLSHHDPWERWFTADELRRWLEPWCDAIAVQHVSHREGRPGTRLFLAARGRRR